MSRLPFVSPTGLPAFESDESVVVNPYAPPGDTDFNAALSIADYAQRAPREQQEALGRALYATTGLKPEPASERERSQIRALELAERTRIARAAADPRNPITQEALNDVVSQHNQRWSMYGFLSTMPSPTAIYAEKAAEEDPAIRSQMISEGLKEYQETGKYNDNLNKVLLSENPADRQFVNDQIREINTQKRDAATAQTKRNETIAEGLGKMLENKNNKDALRTRYQALRIQFPDLPPVTNPDATFEDFRYALVGQQLGLPAPVAESSLIQRFFGSDNPEIRPAANFAGGKPPIDVRRMTAAEQKALKEEVDRTGVPQRYISKDGSIRVLKPSTVQ